jgi:hypothetical protein
MKAPYMLTDNLHWAYNERLRRERRLRLHTLLAWLAIILAGIPTLTAFGCMFGLNSSPLFIIVTVALVLGGLGGVYYLLTHH